MGIKVPASLAGHLVPFVLAWPTQITADVADAAVKVKCPFKGQVVGVQGVLRAVGGTTPHTDIDVEVLKNTTALCSANVPVVNASSGATSGVFGALSAVAGALDVEVDDFFHLKLIDITGGSSPTADGLSMIVWVLVK